MKTLQVGDLAPQFTLLIKTISQFHLATLKVKKVLVYFLSKSLNTRLYNSSLWLRDAKRELEKLGVVILGISTDAPKKTRSIC